jgi:uncharacterized protein YbaP (TraB family)
MRYKYIFLSFLLAVLFIFSCRTVPHTNAIADDKDNNSLLWKIEGRGINYPSYLFGTIHLIRSEDYFFLPHFENAFNKCEAVAFEVDMSLLEDMGKMMALIPKIMMKDDISLRDLVSDDEYQEVKEFFRNMGLPLLLLERIMPMFLTAFTYMDLGTNSFESGDFKSYEMEINKMASNKGFPVYGLETVEYQISMMDSIPYKDQAMMLVKSIRESEMSDSALDPLIQLYREQDIEGLYNAIKSDEISEYEDFLLVGRNKNWIPIMTEMMNEKPVFFAVGAGHLGGEFGVLQLLRNEGYRITPVR